MVEIIGVGTIVALSWLLASAMANESDAEKRRRVMSGATTMAMAGDEDTTPSFTTRAA